MRIACDADDTYIGGSADVLYAAFRDKRTRVEDPSVCDVSSHLGKIVAYSPNGDMTLASASIPGSALHPDGPCDGFKCVGIFKGSRSYVTANIVAKVTARLQPLDLIDQLRDTERH